MRRRSARVPITASRSALVPETIENLLFAGRLICADPVAFASVRGMPQCMAMGQATGVAAATTLKVGKRIQDLDGVALSIELARQGVSGIANRDQAEEAV
ncbi:FAD-dependent oxidoreductase [Phaeobacter gallaeciensis]